MPLWDKVKQELDRAGRVAQDALDEGRIRLEALRVRQHADRAAQALGYAIYRARAAGTELDPQALERLSETLARHENEATKLETQLDEIQARRREDLGVDPAPAPADGAPPADAAPPGPSDRAPTADTVSPTDTGTI
jgi:hypothetical protein